MEGFIKMIDLSLRLLMRNTTKLKQILLKYDLDLSMEEENLMKMTLIDKVSGRMKTFEHSSYSHLISKGYGYLLKELKAVLRKPGNVKERWKNQMDLPGKGKEL